MIVTVDTPTHSYDITIQRGAITQIGTWLGHMWSPQQVVVITDDRVGDYYASSVRQSLEQAGFRVALFVFKAGEESKQLETVYRAYDFLSRVGFTRSDGILALGGGVVGDLAGFIASTYMRGVHFVQVPTSLTAQVDASIGGKTGVNLEHAKNMIGSFAHPDGVLIDPDTLNTLDDRALIEGMGEVIKYAAIKDLSLWHLLETLSGTRASILSVIDTIIYHSCQVKADLVSHDQHDHGVRRYLNFGHTIGHAIEVSTGYGHLMHGEAVAIGMVMISRFAEDKGLASEGLSQQLANMCLKFGLPVSLPSLDRDTFYKAMALDKKVSQSEITLILVPSLGQVRADLFSLSAIRSYLEGQ